jgi:hypothetical protein
MKNKFWCKKYLIQYKKEIVVSTTFTIVFTLFLLLWHYFLGKDFAWREIDPIPKPQEFVRFIYSALVFITFGAFLYWIKFYKFLHLAIVRGLKDWKLYKDIKSIIWTSLILVMYFFVVPKVIDFLNSTISVIYNLSVFILYLLPPLLSSLIIVIAGILLVKKYKI